MSRSGKRIAVACLLTAAMGLMICPPWHGRGHRLLWNGRGSLDWSRLALELCLVAVIGALAAVVAPMVGRPSVRAPKVWFRRASLVLGCAAVLILAATAGYDGIVRVALLRDYNQKVREFQAKGPLLEEAFPLNPGNHLDYDALAKQAGAISSSPGPGSVHRISNVHEAELMLRSLGCDDRAIQRAMARLLSASTPEYNEKILTFGIGASGGKGGDCLPKGDIFDQIAAEAGNTAKPAHGEITVNAGDITPALPPGFTPYKPTTPSRNPSDESYWKPAPPKGRQPIPPKAGQIDFREYEEPETREIVFDFRIEDSDAAKRFFAPLPGWYAEALQHNIEVSRVPDWMKPGEPPASWSFTDWLDLRSPWLILAAGMLVLSGLSFALAHQTFVSPVAS